MFFESKRIIFELYHNTPPFSMTNITLSSQTISKLDRSKIKKEEKNYILTPRKIFFIIS
jgi:hypothetical protein